jgi:hypothetical protein
MQVQVLAGNVKITSNRKGRRTAYRYDMRCARWFPMPVAQAELILAGAA